jgi:hypothetical protein
MFEIHFLYIFLIWCCYLWEQNSSRVIFWQWRLLLAHLTLRPCELLPSLFVRRASSVVHPSTFHILIFSSETTGPIATKLWWNGPWMAPFQKSVRWSRLPTKMAAKLKIEKRGDEILIVHCCFSISKMSSNFNCSYMARSSLTNIPGFSVNFFFQPIYTYYAK